VKAAKERPFLQESRRLEAPLISAGSSWPQVGNKVYWVPFDRLRRSSFGPAGKHLDFGIVSTNSAQILAVSGKGTYAHGVL